MYLYRAAKTKYGGWSQASAWVAPPGCSNHNRGYAADLAGSLGLAHQLAPRFGLRFPMAHENWHIEPTHIPGLY
jgi:LAS superfamily LD-carboxypeptidase LdcB